MRRWFPVSVKFRVNPMLLLYRDVHAGPVAERHVLGEMYIGRVPGTLPSILSQAHHVSRLHCVVKKGPSGDFFVSDRSSSGTFVNGVRCVRGEDTHIEDDDVVTLGTKDSFPQFVCSSERSKRQKVEVELKEERSRNVALEKELQDVRSRYDALLESTQSLKNLHRDEVTELTSKSQDRESALLDQLSVSRAHSASLSTEKSEILNTLQGICTLASKGLSDNTDLFGEDSQNGVTDESSEMGAATQNNHQPLSYQESQDPEATQLDT